MKPIAHYYEEGAQFRGVGQSAFVVVVDHPPHEGGKYICTSRVVASYEDGSFETLNTRYVPLPRAPSSEVAKQEERNIHPMFDVRKE